MICWIIRNLVIREKVVMIHDCYIIWTRSLKFEDIGKHK